MKHVLGALLAVAACRTTAEPARPWVSDSGEIAVTLDQPFGVFTSWEGECNPGFLDILGMAPTPGGRTTVPCNFVDYDVKVTCDDNACTFAIDGQSRSITITPTKLGMLKAHVTLDPKTAFKKKKTFDLKPVSVVKPKTASAVCELVGDGDAQVGVALYGDNKQLVHQSNLRVVGGEPCRANESASLGDTRRTHICKLTTTNAKLELSGPSYRVETSVACALMFPVPELGKRIDGEKQAFAIDDPYNNQCQYLLDKTKDSFKQWGWTIGAIDNEQLKTDEHGRPHGKATIAAERLGTSVAIKLAYTLGDRSGCTWTLESSGDVRGTDQIN